MTAPDDPVLETDAEKLNRWADDYTEGCGYTKGTIRAAARKGYVVGYNVAATSRAYLSVARPDVKDGDVWHLTMSVASAIMDAGLDDTDESAGDFIKALRVRGYCVVPVLQAERAKDNPGLDATDGAHPAWWRGNDAGVASLCQLINKILDGEPITGVSREPWESTRRRIAERSKVPSADAEWVAEARKTLDHLAAFLQRIAPGVPYRPGWREWIDEAEKHIALNGDARAAAATEAERERCAKIAEPWTWCGYGREICGPLIAAAIRGTP